MHVAADLGRDVAAQAAEAADVVALGGLAELPPDMALALALGRHAAALDHHGRRAEVALQMRALGGDVAGVEIDDHGLHPQDLGGFGLAGGRHRAGDHVDRSALAPGPCGEGGHLLRRRGIGLDPDVVRAAIEALTLVDEAAHRDQPVAIAEDHVDEPGDLLGIGLVAEDVDLWRGVVEVPPRVEVDNVLLGQFGVRVPVVAHGLVLRYGGGVGMIAGLVAHRLRLQQRSA